MGLFGQDNRQGNDRSDGAAPGRQHGLAGRFDVAHCKGDVGKAGAVDRCREPLPLGVVGIDLERRPGLAMAGQPQVHPLDLGASHFYFRPFRGGASPVVTGRQIRSAALSTFTLNSRPRVAHFFMA
jgi:hypothetical protein